MILFRLAWFCLHYTEMPKYIVETISFPCCCNAAWFSSFLHQQQRLWWCIFFVLTPFFSQFYRYHRPLQVLSRLQVFLLFYATGILYHWLHHSLHLLSKYLFKNYQFMVHIHAQFTILLGNMAVLTLKSEPFSSAFSISHF